MTRYLASKRFSLPDWVERTLMVSAPGRPLAPSPSPDAVRRAAAAAPVRPG